MLYHRFFPHEAVVILYYFGCLNLSQSIIHRIHAIYGNIYHQYTPNFSIYTSTMDPMGIGCLNTSGYILLISGEEICDH